MSRYSLYTTLREKENGQRGTRREFYDVLGSRAPVLGDCGSRKGNVKGVLHSATGLAVSPVRSPFYTVPSGDIRGIGVSQDPGSRILRLRRCYATCSTHCRCGGRRPSPWAKNFDKFIQDPPLSEDVH